MHDPNGRSGCGDMLALPWGVPGCLEPSSHHHARRWDGLQCDSLILDVESCGLVHHQYKLELVQFIHDLPTCAFSLN
jgi:hypothetical protein